MDVFILRSFNWTWHLWNSSFAAEEIHTSATTA
jgi:hypothetical protein